MNSAGVSHEKRKGTDGREEEEIIRIGRVAQRCEGERLPFRVDECRVIRGTCKMGTRELDSFTRMKLPARQTVMQAKASQLCRVEVIGERNICSWRDGRVQNPIGSDGVGRLVEYGVVDVSRLGNVEEVCLSNDSLIIRSK